MGTITRSFANNLTTNGILKANAFNNASLNNVTALNAAVATGGMVLISSQTASDSASISFTTGINSTYKEYQFYFINIRGASTANFQFNLSTDSGSNYNVTKTTTYFTPFHDEGDTTTGLLYLPAQDLAQSTAFQNIAEGVASGADECVSGSMQLFNPSSTTYVKHFISNVNAYYQPDSYSINTYMAGYGNTTSAVNAVQFKFASGNIADGTILMYGIK
jgi:hypothetical protein